MTKFVQNLAATTVWLAH